MAATYPQWLSNTPLDPSFDKDIRDTHLIYNYDAQDEQGNPQKWKYELWFFSESRVNYAIWGGPMAGRVNYQTCQFQCIRPGELWQCSWLVGMVGRTRIHLIYLANNATEETGTIVSLIYDIPNKKITTTIAFSRGHWEFPDKAHGDKRNPDDFARWRTLAKVGDQTERMMLSEQADILEVFKGAGALKPIDPDCVTI